MDLPYDCGVESIGKIDVARRQIIEAVRLFFEGRDPVVIHTIIASAHQVLHDLGAKTGITGAIKNTSQWDSNFPFNFFKHADRDPEEKIYVEQLQQLTSDFIMDAIFMLQQISGNIPIEAKVFWSWFVSKYPDGFDNLPQDGAIAKMQKLQLAEWDFPRIANFLQFANIAEDIFGAKD